MTSTLRSTAGTVLALLVIGGTFYGVYAGWRMLVSPPHYVLGLPPPAASAITT